MDLLKRLNTRSEIDTLKELIKSSEKAVTEPQTHVHAVFIEIISGKLQDVINRLQYMNAQASTTQTHEEVIALRKVHAAELNILEETLEDLESQIDAAKRQLSWEKRQRLNEKINREDV